MVVNAWYLPRLLCQQTGRYLKSGDGIGTRVSFYAVGGHLHVSSLSSTPDQPAPDQRSPATGRPAGVRLKLFVGQAAIGVGQIDLLHQIGLTGSLSGAAAAMAMDEARAESLLGLMSAGFAAPLVRPAETTTSDLELTGLGAELIRRYREQDHQVQTLSADLKDWLTGQQAS